MTDFIEKRDYLRIQVDCDIHFKLKNSNETQIGHCTSLSSGGVSFIGKQPLTIGDKLEASIHPQNEEKPTMIGIIEIVRAIKLEDDLFEIGAIMQVLAD